MSSQQPIKKVDHITPTNVTKMPICNNEGVKIIKK